MQNAPLCKSVLIRRITTVITGRNVQHLSMRFNCHLYCCKFTLVFYSGELIKLSILLFSNLYVHFYLLTYPYISLFFWGGGGGWGGRADFLLFIYFCHMEKVKRKESSLYIDIMQSHSMHTDLYQNTSFPFSSLFLFFLSFFLLSIIISPKRASHHFQVRRKRVKAVLSSVPTHGFSSNFAY